MGFFSKITGGLFGGGGGGGTGPNPASSAMPYLNQIPGIGKQYYNPFIESGREAEGIVNPIYKRQATNPSEFLNEIMSKYEPSKGYDFRRKELLNTLQNSAASGGFLGTEYDQKTRGDLSDQLLSGDMQQYLSNILGIQGAGTAGEEGRIERGYSGSGSLADLIGSNLGQQAGLAFQGQGQQNANRLGKRNANLNFLSNLIGAGAHVYGRGGGFF